MSSADEGDEPHVNGLTPASESGYDAMKAEPVNEEDEDIAPVASRRKARVAESEGRGSAAEEGVQLDDEDEGGLFGEGSEDAGSVKNRQLDDAELNSDDEDQNDRAEEALDAMEGGDEQGETANIMDVKLARHAVPNPSDGELYLLKFPPFLALEPQAFHHNAFLPPTTEHRSTGPPSANFSPFSTATTTLRWRHSPANPSLLESNVRLLRWSDGSLTMQLASTPSEQYELPAKPLAPPQRNPAKRTPTSDNKRRAINGSAAYNPQLDSHTYLTVPHETSSLLRISHHITTSLTVMPSSDLNDEALVRLQDSLAAAVRGNRKGADGGIGVISITEDPELQKKKAEVAEREKLRAQRRRETQESRDRDKINRTLGKSGLRTGGVGLTVGGLEDDDGMATTRTRARPVKAKRKPRRDDYSDEEDYSNRGRTREDEYDEDDGFLVGSDEDLEVGEASEEEDVDEGIVERGSLKTKDSPKRTREAEVNVEVKEILARGKRRRVVEEDEEDE
ncbi:MAG: hypothetical protein M1827_006541 [Pycnora praestabilis]|nr:MAG: hypothetical protein M1827_006541 [Pycnora praestabilis]